MSEIHLSCRMDNFHSLSGMAHFRLNNPTGWLRKTQNLTSRAQVPSPMSTGSCLPRPSSATSKHARLHSRNLRKRGKLCSRVLVAYGGARSEPSYLQRRSTAAAPPNQFVGKFILCSNQFWIQAVECLRLGTH